MKISIKCLKKYLSLIQSGYSNFVLTEGFKTPLFFFLIQNVLLCQIYSFCCPKIFFISCRTSSTCIERNFPYRIQARKSSVSDHAVIRVRSFREVPAFRSTVLSGTADDDTVLKHFLAVGSHTISSTGPVFRKTRKAVQYHPGIRMALSGHHPPVKGRIRRHYTDVYPRSDKALQGPEATILVHC